MYKVKNKTYQTLSLVIDSKTILIPARKAITTSNITKQMVALKNNNILQIIKL